MNPESAIVIFRLTVCTISGCVRQRQMTQEGAAEYARKTQSRQITEFRANKLLRHLFSANSETRKINRLIRRYSNGLSGAEAEEGEDGGTDGEYAGKEHRVMRSLVPEEMEKQGYEGSTGCLACQACRGKHAARAAGPVVGRRAQEQVIVGGLEETETGTAHHKPPCDIQMRGVFRNVRQQETSGAHEQQAETAQQAWVHLAAQRAGQRRHEHHYERPGRHHHSGLHGIHPESMQQQERHTHQCQHLGRIRDNTGDYRHREHRYAQQVKRQHRILAPELCPDIEPSAHQQKSHTDKHCRQPSVMGVQLNAAYQQAEDNGIEQRILEVELPAGSISGAPKCATVKAIEEAEQYDRDYYTGIFGYFDGSGLKTAVLIRYIGLASDGRTYFYSGGGITVNSRCEDEYKELCDKVYVPWM